MSPTVIAMEDMLLACSHQDDAQTGRPSSIVLAETLRSSLIWWVTINFLLMPKLSSYIGLNIRKKETSYEINPKFRINLQKQLTYGILSITLSPSMRFTPFSMEAIMLKTWRSLFQVRK